MTLDLYFIVQSGPTTVVTALMDYFDPDQGNWGVGDEGYSNWLEAFVAYGTQGTSVSLYVTHPTQPTVSIHELDDGWVIGLTVPRNEALSSFVSRCQQHAIGFAAWFTLLEQPPPETLAECLTLSRQSRTDWRQTR